MRFFFQAYLLFSIFSANPIHQETIDFQEPKEINVLFIGNSLTYSNNLPQLVAAEAKSERLTIKTEMVASPNYALPDHWENGEIQKLIARGNFDFVVAQQGPSSQAEGQQMLLDYGALLKKLCTKYDAELVYFMVWPSRSYYSTFEGVIRNHRQAAKANDALLAPVGAIWKDYFDETGDFSLYGPDGFHPSPKGSALAAKIILETLLNNLD